MSLIIDQKYVAIVGPRLQLFRKKGRCWNFRCPFCGDSQSNRTKSRGYFFTHKGAVIFKCHNCGLSIGLSGFLKQLDPQLAKQYHLEKFADSRGTRIPCIVDDPVPAPVDIDLPIQKLTSLPFIHTAVEYARMRKLPLESYFYLYYAASMVQLEELGDGRYRKMLPNDERLIIPCRDANRHLIGLTGRALDKKARKRYIQMRLVDDVPMIFHYERFKKDYPGYITEGPLDAFFLPNAIACGGMDFAKALSAEYVHRPNITMVFDNQPRNGDVIKRMSTLGKAGYRLCVWPTNWPYKDINDAVMAGVDAESVRRIIDTNTRQGPSLELAIKMWRRC